MKKVKEVKVIKTTTADENHQVVTIDSKGGSYVKKPCAECPWRRENAGSFPAGAFRISARTAYDGAMNTFACHMTGIENPATCAGFLLKNSLNNNGVRLMQIRDVLDMRKVTDGGADLFGSYKEMAVANGVEPDDPVLAQCRADNE